ncbi:MAG: SBBP repeat-containing protein [Chloroflexota bacterium]
MINAADAGSGSAAMEKTEVHFAAHHPRALPHRPPAPRYSEAQFRHARGNQGGAGPRDRHPTGGALVFSTYLGGSAGDEGRGITADATVSVYVTGRTWSTDFPTQSPIQPTFQGGHSDAFVVMYGPDGTRDFGTYLGGSARDDGYDIAADTDQSMYVTGITASTNFPTLNAVQPAYRGGEFDGFVTRIFPNGSSVAYSTYLGGNARDDALAITVVGNTDAHVAESTASTNFPTVLPVQATYGWGYKDAFVARITDDTPPHEESRTNTYDPLRAALRAERWATVSSPPTTAMGRTSTIHTMLWGMPSRFARETGGRLTETTVAGTTPYVYDDARAASRSAAEGKPGDERRRGGVRLVGQRQPFDYAQGRLREGHPTLRARSLGGRSGAALWASH